MSWAAVSAGDGSAPDSGGGRLLLGVGNPNSSGQPPAGGVRGNVGDIFQRLDANPDGVLWVKESGDGTNTGWTPK